MSEDPWTSRASVHRRYTRFVDRGPTIYEYRQPARDWVNYALDWINWDSSWTVLDAGCGRGAYFRALTDRVPDGALFGLDLTAGALQGAVDRFPTVPVLVGDVQSIGMADASIDVVLSAHSLYHVPHIDRAIAEFRRILKPSGVLLAIYDSDVDDQPELDELFMTAGGTVPINAVTNRFSIESAPAYLEAVFGDITVHIERPVMVVPDAGPVVGEIDSVRPALEPHLAAGVTWDDLIARVTEQVERTIAKEGVFRISEHKAVFVCRP